MKRLLTERTTPATNEIEKSEKKATEVAKGKKKQKRRSAGSSQLKVSKTQPLVPVVSENNTAGSDNLELTVAAAVNTGIEEQHVESEMDRTVTLKAFSEIEKIPVNNTGDVTDSNEAHRVFSGTGRVSTDRQDPTDSKETHQAFRETERIHANNKKDATDSKEVHQIFSETERMTDRQDTTDSIEPDQAFSEVKRIHANSRKDATDSIEVHQVFSEPEKILANTQDRTDSKEAQQAFSETEGIPANDTNIDDDPSLVKAKQSYVGASKSVGKRGKAAGKHFSGTMRYSSRIAVKHLESACPVDALAVQETLQSMDILDSPIEVVQSHSREVRNLGNMFPLPSKTKLQFQSSSAIHSKPESTKTETCMKTATRRRRRKKVEAEKTTRVNEEIKHSNLEMTVLDKGNEKDQTDENDVSHAIEETFCTELHSKGDTEKRAPISSEADALVVLPDQPQISVIEQSDLEQVGHSVSDTEEVEQPKFLLPSIVTSSSSLTSAVVMSAVASSCHVSVCTSLTDVSHAPSLNTQRDEPEDSHKFNWKKKKKVTRLRQTDETLGSQYKTGRVFKSRWEGRGNRYLSGTSEGTSHHSSFSFENKKSAAQSNHLMPYTNIVESRKTHSLLPHSEADKLPTNQLNLGVQSRNDRVQIPKSNPVPLLDQTEIARLRSTQSPTGKSDQSVSQFHCSPVLQNREFMSICGNSASVTCGIDQSHHLNFVYGHAQHPKQMQLPKKMQLPENSTRVEHYSLPSSSFAMRLPSGSHSSVVKTSSQFGTEHITSQPPAVASLVTEQSSGQKEDKKPTSVKPKRVSSIKSYWESRQMERTGNQKDQEKKNKLGEVAAITIKKDGSSVDGLSQSESYSIEVKGGQERMQRCNQQKPRSISQDNLEDGQKSFCQNNLSILGVSLTKVVPSRGKHLDGAHRPPAPLPPPPAFYSTAVFYERH